MVNRVEFLLGFKHLLQLLLMDQGRRPSTPASLKTATSPEYDKHDDDESYRDHSGIDNAIVSACIGVSRAASNGPTEQFLIVAG